LPLRYGDPGEIRDAAAELEELGWSALSPCPLLAGHPRHVFVPRELGLRGSIGMPISVGVGFRD